MDIKVTVIVPVHNSEKYLKDCMDSGLGQTLKEVEFLCIDGGSTDSTADIIKEYQQKDSRVISINDPNTSYGHKINVGIRRARGKYIAILESDDRMLPEMLENLYEIAEKYNVDIVDGNYYELCTCKNRDYTRKVIKYPNPDLYDRLICQRDGRDDEYSVIVGIWTALYKKEFLIEQKIWLNESPGASYQDFSFLFLTSFLARSVYHSSIPCYQYRLDNAGSSVKDNKKIFEIAYECNFLKGEMEKRRIQDEEIWNLYYAVKYINFRYNYYRLCPEARTRFMVTYLKELEKDIKDNAVTRDRFEGDLYNDTFLLIDNKDEFIRRASTNRWRTWCEEISYILEQTGTKKIVIFGAGQVGTTIVEAFQQNENKVCAICDNSQLLQGTYKEGIQVLSVEDAVNQFRDVPFVIANRRYAAGMKEQLMAAGIEEKDIIVI